MGSLPAGMERMILSKGAIGETAENAIFGAFLLSPFRPRVMVCIAVARGPMGTVPKRVLEPLLIVTLLFTLLSLLVVAPLGPMGGVVPRGSELGLRPAASGPEIPAAGWLGGTATAKAALLVTEVSPAAAVVTSPTATANSLGVKEVALLLVALFAVAPTPSAASHAASAAS